MTKFEYLKELVEPKIRTDIDGLPLTTEGYSRAKAILSGEYGKTSEIVNAYVQNILELPVVKDTNPNEVDKFYKILLCNVQSLETLGKLERVNGMTRSVIDKLPGIKSDIVRGHEGWQDWGLAQLVKEMKVWRDINPNLVPRLFPLRASLEERPWSRLVTCLQILGDNKLFAQGWGAKFVLPI